MYISTHLSQMTRRRLTTAAVVITSLLVPLGARAGTSSPLGRMRLHFGDMLFLGAGLATEVGLSAIDLHTTYEEFGPTSLDRSARDALRLGQPRAAALASDVMLYTMAFGALFAPAAWRRDYTQVEFNATVVAAEALTATALVTSAVKLAARRLRPARWAGRPGDEAGTGDATSFFSGHTSVSFAAATLATRFAYDLDWLTSDTRWLVPAVAYSAATTVGLLRVAADKHWTTDVLTGAAVGVLTSWLVYQARTRWFAGDNE
jgi:membrane-associated phospholipid phosphatase